MKSFRSSIESIGKPNIMLVFLLASQVDLIMSAPGNAKILMNIHFWTFKNIFISCIGFYFRHRTEHKFSFN